MQKNRLLRKCVVISIIFLFIGLSVAPALSVFETPSSSDVLKRLPGDGSTLYVGGSGPGNFSHIQDAIDSASPGDTVFVYDDSSPYYEHLTIYQAINLIGESRDTTIIDGSGSGDVVYLGMVNGTTISGFTIQNGSRGIYLASSSRNHITGNTITNNTNIGIYLYVFEYKIFDDPVRLEMCYNVISNNTITYNHDEGIHLESTVVGMAWRQFIIAMCEYNNIVDNTIANNGNGIYLLWTLYNNITHNTITNNSNVGIYLNMDPQECGGSESNNLLNNTITNNTNGIDVLVWCSYNQISGNIIAHNRDKGILFSDDWAVSEQNTVTNNFIIHNNVGIDFLNYFGAPDLIYNNYFNNTLNANDDYGSIWSITKTPGINIISGSYLGGNYWNDYNGTDSDRDGIGDTPYNISGSAGSKDYFPLMDNIPPEISNVVSKPSLQHVDGAINITCDVTDNFAVDDVWVNITYPDNTTCNYSMNPSYYFNQTYSQVGIYRFFVWAEDTNGLSNISSGHTFEITRNPPTLERTLLIGCIRDVNTSGETFITFRAKLVVYMPFNPFSIKFLASDETIIISKNNQGYIGKHVIIGIFNATVLSDVASFTLFK